MATLMNQQRDVTLESQALFNLAIERINRNNFRKALDLLIDALRIAPGNPVYLSYFGLCIAQVDGNYERAVQHCRQAVNSLPTDPIPYVNLGKVYRLKGDNASAYKMFLHGWDVSRRHPAVASELTRMGIRRPPFFTFLPRSHWCNKYFGMLRATLERKLVGRRQS